MAAEAPLRRAGRRAALWPDDAVLRVVVRDLVALAGLVAAAWCAGREDAVADQIVCLNVGVASVALSGVSHARWLLAGRSGVGHRRVQLLGEDGPPVLTQLLADEPAGGPGPGAELQPIGTANGRYYHRRGCAMAGPGARPARPMAHARAGRLPCPVCEP